MTRAYSRSARKTKVTQRFDQTSMALVYATGGSELLIDDVVVDMANRVVTVSATRAGAWKTTITTSSSWTTFANRDKDVFTIKSKLSFLLQLYL